MCDTSRAHQGLQDRFSLEIKIRRQLDPTDTSRFACLSTTRGDIVMNVLDSGMLLSRAEPRWIRPWTSNLTRCGGSNGKSSRCPIWDQELPPILLVFVLCEAGEVLFAIGDLRFCVAGHWTSEVEAPRFLNQVFDLLPSTFLQDVYRLLVRIDT